MIIIKKLCKHYDGITIYKDFDIIFEKQKITCILGPSGGGKTTLLKILAGIEDYESGEVKGLDKEKISMIFQEDRLIPWLNVYDNIKFVLESSLKEKEIEERIEKVLKLLKLWEYKYFMPHTLSGGMQRRVAIGRAFAYEGSVILMDEPFKGLDDALKDTLIREIKDLWQQYPKTIICVTHQQEEARKMAHKVYQFNENPVTYNTIK